MMFYLNEHKKFVDAVNKNSDLSKNDLDFSAECPFRKDAFFEKLKLITDNRILKKFIIKSHGY